MKPEIKQPRKEDIAATELNDTIRCRAYELYEQRGRADGHELDDWVEAESEVLGSENKLHAA